MNQTGTMDDDAELLRRYTEQRSEAAFAEIVRRHVDLVYAVALRKVGGDAHLAQDVAQEVFAAVAAKAAMLARHPALAGWLFTSTHYAATQVVRQEQRRRAREQKAQVMNERTQEDEAERALDWERVRPVLDDLVRELKPRESTAIVLRFFEKRSLAEVGARLALTETAARSCVDRALEKLRLRLARRGVASTSAALGLALANQVGAAAPAGLAASVTSAALASVTGGAAATGVLIFMSTTKFVTGVAVVAAAAAIGLGLHGWKEQQAAGEALTAAAHERESLRAEVRQLTARAQTAESNARAAMIKASEIARAPATAARGGPNNPGGAEAAGARGAPGDTDKRQLMAKSLQNPEFRRLKLQSEKAGMPLRYGHLYRALAWTPAQIARFEAVLVEGQQSVADILSIATEKGISPSDPAMLALGQEAKARQDAQMRALLGDAAFEEYQRYDRSAAARDLAARVMADLVAGEAPPSFQQMDRLTRILAANNASFQQGGPVSMNPRETNWDVVIEQAQTVLSPHQLAVLRALREQAQAAAQAEDLMRGLVKTETAPSPAGAAASAMPPGP